MNPGEFIISLSGTVSGERLALALALISALAHATFGAISKGSLDPYLNRGAINVAYSLMSAPLALFVFPLPDAKVFVVLFISYLVHIAYEWFQAAAFLRGAFTLVYPIARGTAPALSAMLAISFFGEQLSFTQWLGLMLLSGAILSLGLINLLQISPDNPARRGLWLAILFAVCTGFNTALYTIIDAYGVRLATDPFTFVFWVFFMGGFGFPVVAFFRWRSYAVKPALRPLVIRGIIGGIIGMVSFGSFMLATRVGRVAEVAALRETSIVFAAIIGVLFFREVLKARHIAAILLIVCGAVLIEFGN